MSDHKIVITDIDIKVKSKKSVPGKIYIYKRANTYVINQHLDKVNTVFTNNSKTNSIQECWEEIKLIKKTVNLNLDESHQNYTCISQLLEVGEAEERKTPVVLATHKIKEKRLMWKSNTQFKRKNYGRQ